MYIAYKSFTNQSQVENDCYLLRSTVFPRKKQSRNERLIVWLRKRFNAIMSRKNKCFIFILHILNKWICLD